VLKRIAPCGAHRYRLSTGSQSINTP
jgi:hypothetical protein